MNNVSNDQLWDLMCRIHGDIGELKGTATATNAVLKDHIEEDKRVVRAMYDTQIKPVQDDVKAMQLTQAKQKGSARTWGLVAAGAASIAGSVAGAATALIKWH
jgi:hypothetical protein